MYDVLLVSLIWVLIEKARHYTSLFAKNDSRNPSRMISNQ